MLTSDEAPHSIEKFLTASQLAEILGVHENYVYEHAASGEMPSIKFGGNRRFRWSEIEAWLDNQRQRTYSGLSVIPLRGD